MFHENEKIIGIPKDIQHLPVAHVLSLSLEAARAIHTGAVPPTSQCSGAWLLIMIPSSTFKYVQRSPKVQGLARCVIIRFSTRRTLSWAYSVIC
ncbi:uncharacterized protein LOC144128254 isoform X5 [Amblyomma americanum]